MATPYHERWSPERMEMLGNPYHTSWRPRAYRGAEYPAWNNVVEDFLDLPPDEVEPYLNGNVPYFLDKNRIVTALLCHQRQMGIVFHRRDMVTVQGGIRRAGRRLFTIEFGDAEMLNAIPSAAYGFEIGNRDQLDYRIFEVGIEPVIHQ